MTVFLADDQADVRSALRLLLEQEPGVSVVGEAADAAAVLARVPESRAEVILLDWELPGLRPIELMRAIAGGNVNIRVVAMSSRPEARAEAEAAGVYGFVSKGDAPGMLLTVLSGVVTPSGEA